MLWLICQKYHGLIQVKLVLLGDHVQPWRNWLWTCSDKCVTVSALELLAELVL